MQMQKQENLLEKSLSSYSARALSQKQQKEALRHTAPDARERIPAPAKWLGPITSTVHTNDSTLTRNKGLRAGSFLERFLDKSEFFEFRKTFLRDWIVFLVEVSKPASRMRDRARLGPLAD